MDDLTLEYYRATFNTDSGKKVLAHLLADMGVFDSNLKTPEEVAIANYAKKILIRLGVIGIRNLDYYANMFVNAPQIIKEREND